MRIFLLSLRNLSRELTRFLCVQNQEINRELSDVIKFAYKRIHFSILNYSSSFDRSMILLIPRHELILYVYFQLDLRLISSIEFEWILNDFFSCFLKGCGMGRGRRSTFNGSSIILQEGPLHCSYRSRG